MDQDELQELLVTMEKEGFSSTDYDVMEKSCNTFTEAFACKLGLLGQFPSAVHQQTRLGQLLAPLVRALDMAGEKSSSLTLTHECPDSGHSSLTSLHSPLASLRQKLSSSRDQKLNKELFHLVKLSKGAIQTV